MNLSSKYKKIIIISAVAICLILIAITVNRTKPTFLESGIGSLLSPVQKLNTNISDWFNSKFNALTNINKIESENEALKEKVDELQEQISRFELIETENKRLSELLDLDAKYSDYEKVGARIIAKDPGNWYDIFIIDKGSNDGLEKNMVVMASGGLVGKIIESGNNYSKVVSIIDDSDSIGAKSLRTDDLGFIRGDLSNKGMCKMEYIDSEAEIIEGDEIITSHLSEIYPPGITIGYVKEIYTDSNNLTKYAVVIPTVDFKHMETVLVIKENFKKDIDVSENS